MRRLAGIVTLGFVLAMTACGGSDNGDKTTKTGVRQGTESTPVTPRAPASKKAQQLARCLKKAGHTPIVLPPPPAGAPGAEFESVGSVRVNVGPNNGVVAIFFKNAKKAKELSKSALAGRGASQVIGTVYLTAIKGKPKELRAFRICLKR